MTNERQSFASVHRWSGVLEHPAYSDAWPAFGLPVPTRNGGWQGSFGGGWATHIEQGRYGHVAKKATWLYAFGVELPRLNWGFNPDQRSQALVSWCRNHVASGEKRPRVGKAAAASPPAFRDLLVSIAESANARRAA